MVKRARITPNLISGSTEGCNAVVFILTTDTILVDFLKEIKQLKEKKYFIIKEDITGLNTLETETDYKYRRTDFGPIARSILIELGSLGYFQNYYEIRGSEMKMHELIATLYDFKELYKEGKLSKENFERFGKDLIEGAVKSIINDK